MIIAGIPSRGLIHSRTIDDVLANKPDKIIFAHGMKQPDAQNYLLKQSLKHSPDYIWFVDDDMKLNPDTLQKLLNANADIALADYPVNRNVSTVKYHDGEFLFGGMGCVLARADILKDFEFRTDTTYSYPDMRPSKTSSPDNRHGGHDVDFFVRLKHNNIVVADRVGQYYSDQHRAKGNNTAINVEVWE